MSIWAELFLTYVLQAYWQATLIAAGAWVLTRCCNGASPASICVIWRAALVAAATVPLIFTAVSATGRSAAPIAVIRTLSYEAEWFWWTVQILCATAIVWRALRLYANWISLGRRRRSMAQPALPPWLHHVVEECATRFPGRPFELAKDPCGDLYTIGWLQPILALPARYFGPTPVKGTASVVSHELAHVERRDFAWNMALECLVTLLAFHPLVGWLKRRADMTRELACDDLVVQRLVPAADYAADLLQFAQDSTQTQAPLYVMTFADTSSLETRIRALLLPPRPRSSLTAMAGVLVLGLLGFNLPWQAVRVDFAPAPPDVPVLDTRLVYPPPPPPNAP
jgi:beta-lactamase regulating signal transducer with metallopeptidase domain